MKCNLKEESKHEALPIPTAFFTSDPIALNSIKMLHKNLNINLIGVATYPDKQSGRGQKIAMNQIKRWSADENIMCHQPTYDPNELTVFWLNSIKIELIFIMSYGYILKKILKQPMIGIFNLHYSLLPENRGSSPITSSIVLNKNTTGVTLITVNSKLDSGRVIDQEVIEVNRQDVLSDVLINLSKACMPIISRNIKTIIYDQIKAEKQNEIHASYTRKISKMDGFISFGLPINRILSHHRAMKSWPNFYFYYSGSYIRIESVSYSKNFPSCIKYISYGEILGSNYNFLYITTIDGILSIRKLQRSGKIPLKALGFLNGFFIKRGACLIGSQSSPICIDTANRRLTCFLNK